MCNRNAEKLLKPRNSLHCIQQIRSKVENNSRRYRRPRSRLSNNRQFSIIWCEMTTKNRWWYSVTHMHDLQHNLNTAVEVENENSTQMLSILPNAQCLLQLQSLLLDFVVVVPGNHVNWIYDYQLVKRCLFIIRPNQDRPTFKLWSRRDHNLTKFNQSKLTNLQTASSVHGW